MQFSCPHCQQPLEADDSFIGTTVNCPVCYQPFTVEPPQPTEDAALPPPDTTPTDSANHPPMVKATCPNCLRQYDVEASAIGTYSNCHVCGKRFRVQPSSSSASNASHRPGNANLSMRKPLVFQCIVLGLIILFTLIFSTNAHAQFSYNPAWYKSYYVIYYSQLSELEPYRINIYAAQREYAKTVWYNPIDWFMMIKCKLDKVHNIHALQGALRGIAHEVVSQGPVDYDKMMVVKIRNEGIIVTRDTNRSDDDADYNALCATLGVAPHPASNNSAWFVGLIMILLPFVSILNTYFALRLHYRCWATLPSGFARMTPGKAVGGLFVPIFGLYWSFPSFEGLGADCAAYAARHGQGYIRKLQSWGLALAYFMSIGGVALFLVYGYVFLNTFCYNSFILSHGASIAFPLAGLLIASARFVAWLIFYRKVTYTLGIVAAISTPASSPQPDPA